MTQGDSPIRIGIFGSDDGPADERHGCGLWPAGYAASVRAAGATPVAVEKPAGSRPWGGALDGLDGVIYAEHGSPGERYDLAGERLCRWCRDHRLPLLGVDHGLHVLNATFGGTTHDDLAREVPEALQHRHPPEKGLRHALLVEGGTRLAAFYGEGEIVVNSEHRRAVCRVARGFRVCARALDGVIEAVEAEAPHWFALGVQWQPASATASGLDIQLFRGLVEACEQRARKPERARRVCAA
jgi:putative glutamine amidotransferase